MVPERHARALPLDEALHHLCLGLGGRARPGLVHAVLWLPAVGEVAVEVDAVRVVARAGGGPVRVRVVHEPDRCATRGPRRRAAERSPPSRPARCRAPGPRRAPSRAREDCPRAAPGSAGPAQSGRSSPSRSTGQVPPARWPPPRPPCQRRTRTGSPGRVWRAPGAPGAARALGSRARDRRASRTRLLGWADCHRHGVRLRAPLPGAALSGAGGRARSGCRGRSPYRGARPARGRPRLLPARSRACRPERRGADARRAPGRGDPAP